MCVHVCVYPSHNQTRSEAVPSPPAPSRCRIYVSRVGGVHVELLGRVRSESETLIKPRTELPNAGGPPPLIRGAPELSWPPPPAGAQLESAVKKKSPTRTSGADGGIPPKVPSPRSRRVDLGLRPFATRGRGGGGRSSPAPIRAAPPRLRGRDTPVGAASRPEICPSRSSRPSFAGGGGFARLCRACVCLGTLGASVTAPF